MPRATVRRVIYNEEVALLTAAAGGAAGEVGGRNGASTSGALISVVMHAARRTIGINYAASGKQ